MFAWSIDTYKTYPLKWDNIIWCTVLELFSIYLQFATICWSNDPTSVAISCFSAKTNKSNQFLNRIDKYLSHIDYVGLHHGRYFTYFWALDQNLVKIMFASFLLTIESGQNLAYLARARVSLHLHKCDMVRVLFKVRDLYIYIYIYYVVYFCFTTFRLWALKLFCEIGATMCTDRLLLSLLVVDAPVCLIIALLFNDFSFLHQCNQNYTTKHGQATLPPTENNDDTSRAVADVLIVNGETSFFITCLIVAHAT